MKENYLVMDPDDSMRWIQIDRSQLLPDLYKAIGCDCIEFVSSIIPGVIMIVDESGKIKDPRQKRNFLGSFLSGVYRHTGDYIAGPAVVAAVRLVDGERDIVPLDEMELAMLRAWGYQIPDPSTLPKED